MLLMRWGGRACHAGGAAVAQNDGRDGRRRRGRRRGRRDCGRVGHTAVAVPGRRDVRRWRRGRWAAGRRRRRQRRRRRWRGADAARFALPDAQGAVLVPVPVAPVGAFGVHGGHEEAGSKQVTQPQNCHGSRAGSWLGAPLSAVFWFNTHARHGTFNCGK
eukprot:496876-Prymnesium_polylepis.2